MEPAGTESVETEAVSNEPALVVDESGSAVAAVTVTEVEQPWTDHAEGNEPRSGEEYLPVTVTVESLAARGPIEVRGRDFGIQDIHGFLARADVMQTAEEASADIEPVEEAQLSEGETVELALTFRMVAGVSPQALFYSPRSDRLITIEQFN